MHRSVIVNNFVVLLLIIINLLTMTNTSPYNEGDQQSDFTPKRISRAIDEKNGKMEQNVEKINSGKADKSLMVKTNRPNVFSTENSTSVWAQIGGTASLPCVVKKNSGTVLWLREWPSASPTLLSVGVNKHTTDDRYYVEHVRHLQNWGLVIKHVHVEDAGVYKCQVSTHPPTIILIHLKVTKAYAEIPGAPDLHLRAGSTLHLTCQIRQAIEPPEYVFWYHEDRMINYDPGVRALPNSESNVLIVPDADKSHDGNYTCKPSNAVAAHINVHVLNATEEENPAAMLHSNIGLIKSSSILLVLIMLITILTTNR